MRKVRYLFFAAFIAVCCGGAMSACVKEDGAAPGSDTKNVPVLLNVGTRSVDATDETPSDKESALHTLRVYAFVGDERVGYYYSDNLNQPATFLMDMILKSTTTQTVDFYVVANEAAMQTSGNTPEWDEMTRGNLDNFYFAQLNLDKGLPMFCKQSETIYVDRDAETPTDPAHDGHTQLEQKITLHLSRPVAKLGVFAAKPQGENSELHITSLTMLRQGTRQFNYLMPQKPETLQAVSPMEREFDLRLVDTEVLALKDADPSNTANYTPVLDEPFYPFENPFGNGGNGNTPGHEHGNVLEVKYKFEEDDDAHTGLVYLPPMVRNNYYTVRCLINNSGKFSVEYMVAPWDDTALWDLGFDYPTYTNPLQASATSPELPTKAPTIFYNPNYDPDNDGIFEERSSEAQGSYSFFFRMSAPSGQNWTATLVGASAGAYSVAVYDLNGRKVESPAASPDFYRIVVRALSPDDAYLYQTVKLGVAFTPTWDLNGSQLLLINGKTNELAWPGNSAVPELIEITQIPN